MSVYVVKWAVHTLLSLWECYVCSCENKCGGIFHLCILYTPVIGHVCTMYLVHACVLINNLAGVFSLFIFMYTYVHTYVYVYVLVISCPGVLQHTWTGYMYVPNLCPGNHSLLTVVVYSLI